MVDGDSPTCLGQWDPVLLPLLGSGITGFSLHMSSSGSPSSISLLCNSPVHCLSGKRTDEDSESVEPPCPGCRGAEFMSTDPLAKD